MLIYRPHRGSLAGAMKEAKTFNSFEDIKNYVVNEWNNLWGYQILNTDDIVLDEESYDDDRIGWKDVHYLCTKKLGDEDYIKEYGHPQCIGFVGRIE